MSQHALVTGATGFVGSNLVRQLLLQGWRVTAFCRRSSDLRDLPATDIQIRFGDLTDPASLHQAMSERPDCLFHTAADTSVWSGHRQRQHLINVEGTRHVVTAALQHQVSRLVYTSSFATWGLQRRRIDETTPVETNAHWIHYIRSKASARDIVLDAVRQQGLPAVILCPGHILGPHDRHNWARLFIMLAQQTLPGVPPGSGAFADVEEVAKAHISAASHGAIGEQYLLGGTEVSYLALLQRAAKLLQVPAPQHTTPAWLLKSLARVLHWRSKITGIEPRITLEAAALVTAHMHCDSSKAMRELNYRITELDPLLRKTLNWLRQQDLPGSATTQQSA